jgi:hypothetical protein
MRKGQSRRDLTSGALDRPWTPGNSQPGNPRCITAPGVPSDPCMHLSMHTGQASRKGRSGLFLTRREDPPPPSPYILSQDRQLFAARSGTSSGPFTSGQAPACAAAMVIGAQLALRFRLLPAGELHQLTCPRQRPFRSRGTRPRIRPVQSGRPAGGASHAARRFLSRFGHRH